MSGNVVPFRRPDDDVTALLEALNPTPPHGIPFSALLQGPASDPDHRPYPVRHPRPVPRWVTSTSLVTIGVALGVLLEFAAGKWF